MEDEHGEQGYGSHTVQDTGHSESAENPSQALGPAHVGELQGHAGE